MLILCTFFQELQMYNANHIAFAPECLTINLGSDCNLNCLYCYSEKNQAESNDHLNETEFLDCVSKAAEIVASNCTAKNIPFYLGFQGSGEPLMYFELLKKSFQLISDLAQQRHLKLFSFITSNGCMEADKYEWAASHFSRICISLDGSQEINDLQRTFNDKNGTYHRICDTINILRQNHQVPAIRTTVTKYNVDKLAPITAHFINELELLEIQVEPIYLVSQNGDLSPDPETFVENYIAAKMFANQSGATLSYSGFRRNETHGRYCNINKNVLFIGRNGNASLCLFKDSEKKESPFVIGNYDAIENRFVIDHDKISKLTAAANKLYPECEGCDIRNSCVKGCPDRCLFENGWTESIHENLRCKINRLLHRKEM